MAERGSWRIRVTPRAEAELKRLPAPMQARVRQAIDRLAADPYTGDIRKLQGRENEWRLRVGEYRVLFIRDTAARVVVLLHVLPRGEAYRT